MIEVLILAIALSMDAFAVSIGLGTKKDTGNLALRAGLFFGLFQGLMPLIGYAAGKGISVWIDEYANLVAFLLLAFIGAKMIYEGLQENIEDDISKITNRVLLILAIATSIDAMAAGFSLTLLEINPFVSCLVIGVVTFCFSIVGVRIGSNWLENRAEIVGGIVLILMGLKFLLF